MYVSIKDIHVQLNKRILFIIKIFVIIENALVIINKLGRAVRSLQRNDVTD